MNKEQLREEFEREWKNFSHGETCCVDEIEDWWLSRFNTIMEEKISQIEKLPWSSKVVHPEWRDEIITILKD